MIFSRRKRTIEPTPSTIVNVILICSLTMSQSSQDTTRYPIRLVLHGKVKYTHPLLDVDGNTIPTFTGKLALVDKVAKEMFETKQVRCIYKINPGYRYFVTSQSQYNRFLFEREHGSIYPHTRYHIYQDEDYLSKS